MILGLQRVRLVERDRAVRRRWWRWRSGHGCRRYRRMTSSRHSPASASIALPPFSASSACARNMANSSRPMPMFRRADRARASRAARSAVVESVPVSAQSLTTSPSRSWPSGPPPQRFGRAVDRGGHLAARARHAPVGDQRDAVAAVLQHAQRRGQLVQFGHAVGARALEAHDHHHVAVELARREGVGDLRAGSNTRQGASIVQRSCSTALVLKQARPRLPSTSRMPPSALERVGGRAQHRRRRRSAPTSRQASVVAVQPRLLRIVARGRSPPTVEDIAMGQPRVEQLADDVAHAARRVELVHVARAVGIDPREQRHGGGQFGQVVPVDQRCPPRARWRECGSRGWSIRRWPAGRPRR